MNGERAQLIARARKQRAEIEQIFIDLDHWNRHVRKPDEEWIDPDPDGELRRIANGLDRMLAEDPGIGPIAPFLNAPGPTIQ